MKSVQTSTITAAVQHEIYSPRENLDQMHDVLVIQRCQRSSYFMGADFKNDFKSAFMRLIILTIYVLYNTGEHFALLSFQHPNDCLTYCH